jgi:hypothetical protein
MAGKKKRKRSMSYYCAEDKCDHGNGPDGSVNRGKAYAVCIPRKCPHLRMKRCPALPHAQRMVNG